MIRIAIGGMSCANCARHVHEALSQLKGVQDVNVDLAKGQATVEATGALSEAQIREVLEEEGYELKGIAKDANLRSTSG